MVGDTPDHVSTRSQDNVLQPSAYGTHAPSRVEPAVNWPGAKPPRSARCKNPDCTEAISLVRAVSPYNGPDGEPYFEIGATFSVHSKDNQGMWEGKFPNGKVGLFPRGLVTELNVFDKSPRFLVARDVTEPKVKVEPVADEEPTTIEPDGGDVAAQPDDANAEPNVGSAEPAEEALPTFDKVKPDNGDTYFLPFGADLPE